MLTNNFLTIGMFQLKLELESNYQREYIVPNKSYYRQMDVALEIIKNGNCNVIIFPEMSYHENYYEDIKKLSKSRIIIFGSVYENGKNTTKVFQDEKCFSVIKRYPSSAEPMHRNFKGISPNQFIEDYLCEHTFSYNGVNIYVLNCLEYYQAAYFIARTSTLNSGCFIFCCPCSNSNTQIFEQETIAIHNHNEHAYTFMCNTISTYNNFSYGDGKSYIYGPIQACQKDWLNQETIPNANNVNCIATLNSTDSLYIEGFFFIKDNLSRFGRSDFYITTPQDIKIIKI